MSLPLAPAWLVAKCVPANTAASEQRPATELDTPGNIARAAEWARTAEPAVEGAGGDTHTYNTACRVRDFGVSEAVAWELLLEHWNERCAPPWDPDALWHKIENAYRYGKNAPGAASPEAAFEPIVNRRQGRLFYESAGRLVIAADPDYLIRGVIDRGSATVLYGAPNVGKSFAAMNLSAHVALGRPWCGRKVRQGLVVYLAAEAARGAVKRIVALREQMGLDDAPFVVVPCAVDLRDNPADLRALSALVRDAAAEYDQPCELLVIDTLARAFPGGEENSSKDMGTAVKAVDALRTGLGCAVLLVHHSGKDAARGARGHSSLLGAVDGELEAVEVDGERSLRNTKARDDEKAKPIRFALERVVVGHDSEGDEVSTCVVHWEGEPGFAFASGKEEQPLTPSASTALDALRRAAADPRAFKGRAHARLWAAYWLDDTPELMTPKAMRLRADGERKRFQRVKSELVEAGAVQDFGGNFYAPRDDE